MMRVVILLIATVLVSCNSTEKYQKMSVGQTGCAWTEIQVSEIEEYRWIAECNNRRYRCSDAGHSPVCKIMQDDGAY